MKNIKKKEIYKIKEVSDYIKSGDYDSAKELYISIRKNTNPNRKAFISSIDYMIAKLSKENTINYNDIPNTKSFAGGKKSNVILLINPSHAHEIEKTFWEEFGEQATNQGYQIVELAFRNVTPYSKNLTIVHPARALDLAKKYNNYESKERPGWVDEKLLNHYSDWEHRRWQLDKYYPKVKVGISNTAKFIDEVILKINPAMVVTTNKIDWPNNFGFLAAKHYGIDYFFIERSPLDSHIIETEGMFGESNVAERLIFSRGLELSRISKLRADALIEKMTLNPYGFRADEAIKSSLPLLDHSKKVFFLPLDNIIWTGWGMPLGEQGKIDYPIYGSPSDALQKISKEVRALGGQLVIKPHPSCKEWSRLSSEIPNVIFCDSDLQELVQAADVVVTFLTKVSYVALAYNKPVVSFGTGLLDGLGVTYQVSCEAKLKWQLEAALRKVNLKQRLIKFNQILPALDDTFFDDGKKAFEFMLSNTSISDIDVLVGIKSSIEKIQRYKSNKLLEQPEFKLDVYKPTVLFDVSRLTSGGMWNSGISRYARALVKGLNKTRLFNVICGANFSKNEHGLSAFYLDKIETELGTSIVNIKEAFTYLEKSKSKYIYHSPINPEQLEVKHEYAIKVLTIHDILHATQAEFYKEANTITPRIINAVDHEVTGVIFDSVFSKNDFESYTKTKVKNSSVVHLGVDDAFLEDNESLVNSGIKNILNSPQMNIVIPFQGDPRKGFARMLDIAREWQEKSLESRRVIVFGAKRNKYRFDEILNSHWQSSNVKGICYISDCTDQDLAYIYKNSIAHLYLSESEGFGLPPLEAMSCGCPSLTLSNSSLTEVYEGWSFRFDNNVTDKILIGTLEKLVIDPLFLNTMRYEAIGFSNAYCWKKTTANTTSFYLELFDN